MTWLIGTGIVLLILAFFMGDTSLGGPGMIVQIVFALNGAAALLAAVAWGIARLFT
jgi:hypothetical protein